MANKLIVAFFLISLLINSAKCECFTYNFEENFDAFDDNTGICNTVAGIWSLGNYSDEAVSAPDIRSESFISPGEFISCISSFTFGMSASGVFEVNIYMESNLQNDQVTVLVNQLTETGSAAVGNLFLSPASPDFESGWHSLRTSLTGSGNFDGFVTFAGLASQESVLLVDSFRYIPPDTDENLEECQIYRDDTGSTITEPEGTDPTVTELNQTDPTVTEPDQTDPTVTEPDQTDPMVTEPGETDPTVTNPDETDPTVTEPGETDPTVTNPDETDPTVTEPDQTVSTVTEPNQTDAAVTEPDQTDPTVTEPYETDPTVTEPDVTVTDSNETNTTATEPNGTGSTETVPNETDSTVTEASETGSTVTEPNGTGSTETEPNETEASVTDSDQTTNPTLDPDDSGVVTEEPAAGNNNSSGFWNVLTISMVLLASLIALVLICFCFYEIGRRQAKIKSKPFVFEDYEIRPKPIIPRVTKYYDDLRLNIRNV